MLSQLSQHLTQIDGIHQSSGYKFSLDKMRYGSIAFMCKIVVFAAITIDFFLRRKAEALLIALKDGGIVVGLKMQRIKKEKINKLEANSIETRQVHSHFGQIEHRFFLVTCRSALKILPRVLSLCLVVFGSSIGVVVVETEKGRTMFYKFWFLI
jgi:hypothetical protein